MYARLHRIDSIVTVQNSLRQNAGNDIKTDSNDYSLTFGLYSVWLDSHRCYIVSGRVERIDWLEWWSLSVHNLLDYCKQAYSAGEQADRWPDRSGLVARARRAES